MTVGAATLAIGDRVMWDGPEGWQEGEVVSCVDERGIVSLRLAGGGVVGVPLTWIDPQRVSVEQGRGRQQRDADPETLRLAIMATADALDFEHRLVLDELVGAGDVGMMDRDHVERHERTPAVVRKIRENLARQGLVEDTGLKRPTLRGRARVWRVTARGRAVHDHLHHTYAPVGSR